MDLRNNPNKQDNSPQSQFMRHMVDVHRLQESGQIIQQQAERIMDDNSFNDDQQQQQRYFGQSGQSGQYVDYNTRNRGGPIEQMPLSSSNQVPIYTNQYPQAVSSRPIIVSSDQYYSNDRREYHSPQQIRNHPHIVQKVISHEHMQKISPQISVKNSPVDHQGQYIQGNVRLQGIHSPVNQNIGNPNMQVKFNYNPHQNMMPGQRIQSPPPQYYQHQQTQQMQQTSNRQISQMPQQQYSNYPPPSHIQQNHPPIGSIPIPYPPQSIDQRGFSNASQMSQASQRNSPYYEQKIVMFYQKLTQYLEKHEYFRLQINYLTQQLDAVNSEDQWIDLKNRHAQLLKNYTEEEQLLIDFLKENQQMIEQIERKSQLMQSNEGLDTSNAKKFEQLYNSFKILQTQYGKLFQHNQQLLGVQAQFHDLQSTYSQLQQRYASLQAQLQGQNKNDELFGKLNMLQQTNHNLMTKIKDLQNQNSILKADLKKSSMSHHSQSSQIDKREYDKIIQILKQRDLEIQQLKFKGNDNDQGKLQTEIRNKNKQIQNLKDIINEMENQHKEQLHQNIQELDAQIRSSVMTLQKRIKEMEEELAVRNREKQQMKRDYEAEIQSLNKELDRKNMQSSKTFRQLEDKILELEEEVRKKNIDKDGTLRQLNNRIAELQDEITRKNYEVIRPLTDKNIKLQEQLNQKSIELSKYRQGNQFLKYEAEMRQLTENAERKNQEILQLKRQKDKFYQLNQQIQAELDQTITELNKKKTQVNSLKRQAGQSYNYESENKNLNELLNKKNLQISQLKGLVLETQQLKNQLNTSYQSNQRLNETIKSRNKEIASLKETIFNLQQKNREVSLQANNLSGPNNKQLVEQIEYLQQTSQKKDQQLNKMRQTLQLKQTNIQELQFEKQRLKGRMSVMEKSWEDEKEDFRRKIQNSERDAERKLKHYEEFHNNLKMSSEEQIQQLRQQLRIKQDAIFQLSSGDTELRSKLAHFEKIKSQAENEINNLRGVNADLKSEIRELNMKIDLLNNQLDDHEQKMKQFRVVDSQHRQEALKLKQKITQHQMHTSNKESALKTLQNQLKQMTEKYEKLREVLEKEKAKAHEKLEKEQSQIALLNQKISSYEHKLMNLHEFANMDLKMRDYKANQIFEQKIIYQLKAENEKLRGQLLGKKTGFAAAIEQYKNKRLSVSRNKNKKNSENQKITGEGMTNIQKRLQDFNLRLEEIIFENRQNQLNQHLVKEENNIIVNRLENNEDQLILKIQSQYNRAMENHEQQLHVHKMKVLQLQKYASTLQSRLKSLAMEPKRAKLTTEQQSVFNEQIGYYKQKNKQLQGRVDSLIQVNNDLKEKLNVYIKGTNGTSTTSYYKNEIESLKETIETLNIKIKKMNDQNKQLRNEIKEKQSSNDNISNFKIIELENQILEATRKRNEIQYEKSSLEIEKNSLINQVEQLNSEIYQLKMTSRQKMSESTLARDSNVRALQTKCENYEIQISKLENKCRVLQSEGQRLNELINKRGMDSNLELVRLRNRLADVQEQLYEANFRLQTKNSEKANFESQVKQLRNELSYYETENMRINQLYKQSMQKTDNSDSQSQQLYRLSSLIKQQEFEIQRYKGQISSLNSQIIFLKTKSSSFDLSSIKYSMQFLRSNYLQIDAIFGQLKLKNQQHIQLAENFRTNVNRGLDTCSNIIGKLD